MNSIQFCERCKCDKYQKFLNSKTIGSESAYDLSIDMHDFVNTCCCNKKAKLDSLDIARFVNLGYDSFVDNIVTSFVKNDTIIELSILNSSKLIGRKYDVNYQDSPPSKKRGGFTKEEYRELEEICFERILEFEEI